MARVFLAMHSGPMVAEAIVSGGLCIRAERRGLYQLWHINSGLRIGPAIRATKAQAEAFLDEMAAITDWTAFDFDFENIAPDLPERVTKAFQARREQYQFQPRSSWSPENLATTRALAAKVRAAREET